MAWPGETDFATLWPELAAQWHPTRNGALTPSEVLPGSHRKVWWRCEKGHEWQAEVKTRVNGCGCPVCANRKLAEGENDLATLRPELAAQWHPTRNGSLTPETLRLVPDARYGGAATKAMNGRPVCCHEPVWETAVRSVPASRSFREKTIWPASFPNWPLNGIRTKTAP